MGKFLQPCMDCGVLSKGGRCRRHQAQRDRERQARQDSNPIRQAKKQALYGGDYRRRANAVKATATNCYLCGQSFTPTDIVHADHLYPGQGDSPLVATHKFCNESKGNRTQR